MRFSTLSPVVLVVSSFAIAGLTSPAVAQINFAKSTINFARPADHDAAAAVAPPSPESVVQAAPPSETMPADGPAFESTAPSENSAPSEQPRYVPTRPIHPVSFALPTPQYTMPQMQMPTRAPALIGVYGTRNAEATLSRLPHPAPVTPRQSAVATRPHGKPFQNVQQDPAISPYLYLYGNNSSSNNLMNYYAIVRPQLDQQQANRQQAAEIQKLRGQVQRIANGGSSDVQPDGMAEHAHFMDTAQFYNYRRR